MQNDLISRSKLLEKATTAGLYDALGNEYPPRNIVFAEDVIDAPAVDSAPVAHGRWILAAHNEHVNYRWNVTSECSKCHSETKEIWCGFFPNFDDSLASEIALDNARRIELKNYCPDCGARMDGKDDENGNR